MSAGYGVHEREGYGEAALERWVDEPAKRTGRGAFERDRARVLHSSALRRLAGKTQVVEPGESDFPRTRLTHSLECAQIGRELGKSLGADPDLVETACLAHDLGHPPFGHNGEAALDAAAAGCGGFEGNAQSLRLLTRLEAKTFVVSGQGGHGIDAESGGPDGPKDRSAGLNLTRAALDAVTKYPWAAQSAAPFERVGRDAAMRPAARPYGVYADDLEVFGWLRADAPDSRRCLEAQVMDWADDVAYSVHDLEDGVQAGYVRLDRLQDAAERRAVCELAAVRYADASPEELEEAFGRLLALPCWPAGYTGDLRSLAALKDMTSQLIGRFCAAAQEATRGVYGPGPLPRYAADLVVPRDRHLECAVLKGMAAFYVMSRTGASHMRARQRDVITELVDALWRGAPEALEPALRGPFDAAGDDAARLRVVVDQVASLTDTSATHWHDRLVSTAGRSGGAGSASSPVPARGSRAG